MRVRTTQEMLDSQLVLMGWRVFTLVDGVRMYATGAGTWTPDKARAYLFTDAHGSARKGNDDGRRWAWNHARHLIGEHTKAQWPLHSDPRSEDDEDYEVLKVKVVCVRQRVWRQPRPTERIASCIGATTMST